MMDEVKNKQTNFKLIPKYREKKLPTEKYIKTMKKLLFFISLTIFIICFCSCSKEYKAKRLIKKELNMTLNDRKSYEPVLFGNLDSLFSSYKNDTNYINNEDLNIYINGMSEEAKNRHNANKYDPDYTRAGGEWQTDFTIFVACLFYKDYIYQQIRDSIERKFKPQFVGYKMSHKFRAKNMYGASILNEKEYFFNKTISSIITLPTLDNTKVDTVRLNEGLTNVIQRAKQESPLKKLLPK
jgi:hypothetical protein